MKKTFLYLMSAALLSTTLSSCLGNSESTYENQNEFSIVKIDDNSGAKYALTASNLYVNSDDINKYDQGDVLLLNYKVNFDNYLTEYILKADYAAPAGENSTFRNASQKTVQIGDVDLSSDNNPNAFTSLGLTGVGHTTAGSLAFLNRWLFIYQAKIADGQAMSLDLFFDINKQYDESGNDLPENTYILDAKLNITGTPNTGAESTNKENRTVFNLTNIKHQLTPDVVDEDGVVVKIRFRYYKSDNSEKPTYTPDAAALVYIKE